MLAAKKREAEERATAEAAAARERTAAAEEARLRAAAEARSRLREAFLSTVLAAANVSGPASHCSRVESCDSCIIPVKQVFRAAPHLHLVLRRSGGWKRSQVVRWFVWFVLHS